MTAPIEGIALAIVIVGLALSTFVTRTSFLVAGARGRLHPRIETALRYAPVCTLTAIIVPDVLMHAQHADFSLLNPRLVGALVSGLWLVFSRNIFGCLALGMAACSLMRLAQ
ncbi:MAG TPA: AzlD domain-containing protein [Steroidobacteraceae bacterium]